VIIVTGASRGIGKAICEQLVSSGFSVLGLSRDVSGLPFLSISCDVTSYNDIKEVVKFIKEQKFEISGLVNAAGIASMNLALFTPPDVTRKILETNLIGTIFSCQNFAPLMIRNKKGSIVNFSTIAVPLGLKGESIYVASKAGIEGFTKSFAREMADFNIVVNCIAPGPIDTELLKGLDPNMINNLVNRQVIRKQFTKEDIAKFVESILSPDFNLISGAVYSIGGV
jgi:3-oxoacyl-[acyl-carrier protein] reductase